MKLATEVIQPFVVLQWCRQSGSSIWKSSDLIVVDAVSFGRGGGGGVLVMWTLWALPLGRLKLVTK